jgi:hypothetical protein
MNQPSPAMSETDLSINDIVGRLQDIQQRIGEYLQKTKPEDRNLANIEQLMEDLHFGELQYTFDELEDQENMRGL